MPTPFTRGRLFWTRVPNPDGRAIQRSLDTGDPAVARHMAGFLEQLRLRGTDDDRWVLGRLARGEAPVADAYRAWGHGQLPAWIDAQRHPVTDPRLADFLEAWQQELVRRGRPDAKTRAKYLSQVQTFVTPTLRVSGCTRPAIRAWLRALPVGQPNRYRAALSSFCAFLVLEDVLPHNPVRDVPATAEHAPRERYLDWSEVGPFLGALPDPLHRALHVVLLATAGDLASVHGLRREDVHGEAVRIRGTKTVARDRMTYLYARWQGLWAQHVAPLLATCLPAGQPFAALTEREIRRGHQAACHAVRLTDYLVKDHRHTWAVQAVRDGLPLRAIQQQLGHRGPTMGLRVYTKHRVDQDAYRMDERALRASGDANG